MKTIQNNKENNPKLFQKEIETKFNGRIKLISEYFGYKKNVTVKCLVHNIIFGKKAGDLKRSKYGCNKCAKESSTETKKDSAEIIIDKAKKKHEGKYCYKKSTVTDNMIINILCKKHDEYYNQNKKSHLEGHTACSSCKLEFQKNRDVSNFKHEVRDLESFVNKSKSIHDNKFDYKNVNYKGIFEVVKIICNTCGEIFTKTPNDHIHNKQGCTYCGIEDRTESLRLKKEDFIERIKEVHKDKYIYDLATFVDSKTKVNLHCKIHKIDFLKTPGKLLLGHGCYECGKDNIRIDINDAIKKSKELFKDKYDYSNSEITYKKGKTYFSFFCKNCEIGTIQRLDEHLKGTICRYCNGEIKNTEMFIKKAINVHRNKYDYSKSTYNGYKKKLIIICKKHGEFPQSATIHLSGSGCPKCSSSKGELKIINFLDKNNITYKHDTYYSSILKVDDIDKKLRFDFYLPDYKLFIEYDGRQHHKAENFGSKKDSKEIRFKQEKERDERKNKLVEKNKNYRLLRILYKQFENIDSVIEKVLKF